MEGVFWALVTGSAVLAFMLYGVIDELGNLRNDVKEMKAGQLPDSGEALKHLKSIDDNLSWKGTIHQQLLDIEKAVNRD